MGKIKGWSKVVNFTKRHDNEQKFRLKNTYGLYEVLILYKDKRGFWVVNTPQNTLTFSNYYNAKRQAYNYMKRNPNG